LGNVWCLDKLGLDIKVYPVFFYLSTFWLTNIIFLDIKFPVLIFHSRGMWLNIFISFWTSRAIWFIFLFDVFSSNDCLQGVFGIDIILSEGEHALLLSWNSKSSISGYLQFKLSDYPVIKETQNSLPICKYVSCYLS
jgi:hypothetical protein